MKQHFEMGPQLLVGDRHPVGYALSGFQTDHMVATHLQWQESGFAVDATAEIADGHMLYMLRKELPAHISFVDERPTPLPTIRPGQFMLLDLQAQQRSIVKGDVETVGVYISREAVKRFQMDTGIPPRGLPSVAPGGVFSDKVVENLVECLLPAFSRPNDASELFMDYVSLALLSHLTNQQGFVPTTDVTVRGNLAPWQERRAKELLMANMDGGIGLETLASECRLSRSHFARAFKNTCGMSPLRWLNGQRIEQAKILLSHSDSSLEYVARSCGFSDASHLSRAFTASTGVAPGAWRRSNKI